MGPKKVLLFLVREDLRVMVMKEYSTFPKLQDGNLTIRCSLMSYLGHPPDVVENLSKFKWMSQLCWCYQVYEEKVANLNERVDYAGCDTKLHPVLRLQFWSSGKYEVTLWLLPVPLSAGGISVRIPSRADRYYQELPNWEALERHIFFILSMDNKNNM